MTDAPSCNQRPRRGVAGEVIEEQGEASTLPPVVGFELFALQLEQIDEVPVHVSEGRDQSYGDRLHGPNPVEIK